MAYRNQFCTIFANQSFCVVYVRIHKLAAQQDTDRSAKLQEIDRIVRMKQELVLCVAGIDHIFFICRRGRGLCRGREGTLFTFGEPFNYL